MSVYEISSEAEEDLWDIWKRIASDNVDLANRIEREFYKLFESLASTPGQGHSRRDLTSRPVLFFPLYSFLVVYQHKIKPIRIMACASRQAKCTSDLEGTRVNHSISQGLACKGVGRNASYSETTFIACRN